jgi:hypothetical protein
VDQERARNGRLKDPKMAKGKRKKKLEDLPGQADPRAPLDAEVLLAESQKVVEELREDLTERATASPAVTEALKARHAAEKAAKTTADSFAEWQARFVEQVAAAWLLSCVFVRILEDRGLLGRARIAGSGAADSQRQFFDMAPSLNERDYLRLVFRELSQFAVAKDLFDAKHNPVWLLAPSAKRAKALLRVFRTPSVDAPALRFGQEDTRFVGDLYQDLDEGVRKRFALLQTPRFVESFILDRTLEPAIEKFGLDDTTVIDPTCGSGHFLLGSFERLFDHRLRAEPGLDEREAARKALDAVYGADINPYAVAISRFRLTLAFLEKAGFKRIADAPKLPLHLVVADSLLHNPNETQVNFSTRPGQLDEVWRGEEFALQDRDASFVLHGEYSVVLGNPPFSTPAEPILKEHYRHIYRSATGKFTLSAPFVERYFQFAQPDGFVGLINSTYFALKRFGRPLIEEVLPSYTLDTVANTSGVWFPPPGFKTSTGILFGRRTRQSGPVCVVRQTGQDSGAPAPGELSKAWQSVIEAVLHPGFSNEYVESESVPISQLRQWPWQLVGGAGATHIATLESRSKYTLDEFLTEDGIGFAGISGADEIFRQSSSFFSQFGLNDWCRPSYVGDDVRDYGVRPSASVFWPYDDDLELRKLDTPALHYLWRFQPILATRATFHKTTYSESGEPYWKWHQISTSRLQAERLIAYAEIASEASFTPVSRGPLPLQSAMCFRVRLDEDQLSALLAFLNSSTIQAFLLKRFGRGERRGFRLSGTLARTIPVPEAVVEHATTIQHLRQNYNQLTQLRADADAHKQTLLQALADNQAPASALATYRSQVAGTMETARRTQAELDWIIHSVVRDRHADSDQSHRGLADRSRLLQEFPDLTELERPEFTRNWAAVFEQIDEEKDPHSSPSVRATLISSAERALSDEDKAVRETHILQRIEATVPQVLDTLEHGNARKLLWEGAVPYAAAQYLSESGLQKLDEWRRAWERARQGKTVWSRNERPSEFIKEDYRTDAHWFVRGKLNVPRERFISYPDCESDQDHEPIYGWAGWDHEQRAKAIATLYWDRKTQEGWEAARLAPMLAGLLELLPWLHQWHGQKSEEYGGDSAHAYYDAFLNAQCAELGLTHDDLRRWRPPDRRRGAGSEKKKRGAAEVEE